MGRSAEPIQEVALTFWTTGRRGVETSGMPCAQSGQVVSSELGPMGPSVGSGGFGNVADGANADATDVVGPMVAGEVFTGRGCSGSPEPLQHHLAHQLDRSVLAGPETELLGGLADEHLQSRDGEASTGLRLAQQPGLERVIDRVEDHHAGLEDLFRYGTGIDAVSYTHLTLPTN